MNGNGKRRSCVTYGNLSSLQLPSACERAGRLLASNGGLLKSANRNVKMFRQSGKIRKRSSRFVRRRNALTEHTFKNVFPGERKKN